MKTMQELFDEEFLIEVMEDINKGNVKITLDELKNKTQEESYVLHENSYNYRYPKNKNIVINIDKNNPIHIIAEALKEPLRRIKNLNIKGENENE